MEFWNDEGCRELCGGDFFVMFSEWEKGLGSLENGRLKNLSNLMKLVNSFFCKYLLVLLNDTLSFHGPVTGRSECVCQWNDSSHRHYDSLQSNIGHSDIFPFCAFTQSFPYCKCHLLFTMKGIFGFIRENADAGKFHRYVYNRRCTNNIFLWRQPYYKRRKLSLWAFQKKKYISGGGFIICTNLRCR